MSQSWTNPAARPEGTGSPGAPLGEAIFLSFVLLPVEYEIDMLHLAEFHASMAQLEVFRRRTTAPQWGLFADPQA